VPLQLTRRARAQAPFLVVVALIVAAVVYLTVEPGHWVRGTAAIAIAMLLGGALRLLLPESRIGLLRVRGRWWDSFCYLALGVVILVADLRLRY
jgi:hypothetical protein